MGNFLFLGFESLLFLHPSLGSLQLVLFTKTLVFSDIAFCQIFYKISAFCQNLFLTFKKRSFKCFHFFVYIFCLRTIFMNLLLQFLEVLLTLLFLVLETALDFTFSGHELGYPFRFLGLPLQFCLLYTSDAADDTPCVDLGGRRIIKKKTMLMSNGY
eukprot:TRINITY_DN9975_c0_g1_i1.p2 TRINITY_DN9975_c0_g1~~TRINITY_DN9975_c0_g1_i1.p2  ORF type:complete len:157 (-),score=11.31 TRINITY_DN9975_c0_g1_i1:71-541(-)